jgi:hypothetical protein
LNLAIFHMPDGYMFLVATVVGQHRYDVC